MSPSPEPMSPSQIKKSQKLKMLGPLKSEDRLQNSVLQYTDINI